MYRRFSSAVLPAIIATLVLILASCLPPNRSFDEKAWRGRVEATAPALLYAPHIRDNRYFNPWMPMNKGLGDLLRWRLSEKTAYTLAEENSTPPVVPHLHERIQSLSGDFIAWIGHASFLIRIDGQYWLTDPMFSERALLPKRQTPPAISVEAFVALPGRKHVILSHNHYDHLDRDTLKRLPADTKFYVPLGLKALLHGLGKQNVEEMDWWQSVACQPAAKSAEGCRVVCLPTQHWSRRSLQDTNASLWGSFLIEAGGRRIYFGGDSGYFIGYREIGRRFPGIDYALLPVTAYDPRWFMHYAHMDAREALDAFHDLGARYFIPTQWGAFRLGDEPVGHAPWALSRVMGAANVSPDRVIVMEIGGLLPLETGTAKYEKLSSAPSISGGSMSFESQSKNPLTRPVMEPRLLSATHALP